MMDFKRELSHVQEDGVNKLKEEISTKGSAEDLQNLTERLNVFQDVENVWNFENIYLPRMKKFFD